MLSQALIGLLKREVSNELAAELLNLARQSPLEDSSVLREDGVSFNPRPARFIDLAFRFSHSDERILRELLTKAAFLMMSSPTSFQGFSEPVKAIWLLDAIRHLKFTSLKKNEKEKVRSLKNEIEEALISPELKAAIDYALARYA